MRLLPSDKGSKIQAIKIHHRRLRHLPTPNSIKFAHWALQVGDYFYEIAAPPKDFVEIEIEDKLIKALRSEDEEEEDEEQDDVEDSEEDNEGDPLFNANGETYFSDEDNYKSHVTIVDTIQGHRVPLQISKGDDWRRLNNIKSITIGSTYLKPEKVRDRAVHIFRSVFRERYDFFYYN